MLVDQDLGSNLIRFRVWESLQRTPRERISPIFQSCSGPQRPRKRPVISPYPLGHAVGGLWALSFWRMKERGAQRTNVSDICFIEESTPHNVLGNFESGFKGGFKSLWKLATSCHLFIGSQRVGDGNCFNTWHRNKHASWLLGFVWPGGSSLRAWKGGNTQPGQETGVLTPALSSVTHGILDNLKFSNLKLKGKKEKSPETNFFKLWSSLLVWFLNSYC